MSKTYIRATRAWWAQANQIGPGFAKVEEFILQQPAAEDGSEPDVELVVAYDDDSGLHGQKPGVREAHARLCVIDESGWHAFVLWHDFFVALGSFARARAVANRHPVGKHDHRWGEWLCTADEFEQILRDCGFEDATPTTNPARQEPPA
ncbi:MAG: hypothetical protein ABW167_07605 [Baekduia sp.]